MTTTQQTIEGRPALRLERRLDYPVERVWRAVTEPAELERWFVSAVHWTPELGESFEAAGQHGQITELDPPRRFAWRWATELYSFDLTPDGEGCLLVFTHVFNPELGPGWQHAAGWETYFDRLAAHLAGGYLSEEEAHENIDALISRYREQFAAG